MTTKRAPFSPDLQPLRDALPELVKILDANPEWYGSIYFERKASKTIMVNLKQTNLSDNISTGVVMRIYDGYTLFEQATDDLDLDALKRTAQNFVQRVKGTRAPEGTAKRPYRAPTWADRLAAGLDPEISSQIPSSPTPSTQVHFGVRIQKDPVSRSTEGRVKNLRALLDRCLALAPKAGLQPEDLTYATTREGFTIEESIFVDRETNMSQTLYRLALTLITMSGADRTVNRIGGLGGLEAIDFRDEEILGLLKDLAGLKKAERLKPGRYRVLIGPVLSGVLAHEAFGHSQEGDTCARGRSRAWDLHHSGEKVGNQHATILNNPAIFENGEFGYAAWGSYFFDEEGWLAQEQVLLDRGKLKAPMTNLTSAIRLGVPRTANGKRENWAQGVYTRQTNTYFSPGGRTLDQLMAELKDGYIAMEPAGGMEDPKGMGIQVGIQFLQEVKNGKPTGRYFKGPAGGDIQMTGYTPDVLSAIVAKSKIECHTEEPDRAKHPFNDAGGCGKYHKELVFAGCGGPYMLLDPLILG